MPELPDLQVFSSNLKKEFSGKKLQKVAIINGKNLSITHSALKSGIAGASITDIHREGKELFFVFDNGNRLSMHMMLKGKIVLFESVNEAKNTLVEFYFDNGKGIALTDQLKQARIRLNPEENLVPDALSSKLNKSYLQQALGRFKGNVKAFLLDQDIIRGIGNAYSDEILYVAGISPFSMAQKIPADKVKELASAIKKVLKDAEKQIRKINPDIVGGEERSFLKVHHSGKELTPKGEKIIVEQLKGRSTYFTDSQVLYN
jgi:formamidopyrimidine-DNA glycosylase